MLERYLLQGLAPIARADACVLILGSMPGAASLQAGQYYAHRQNRFWRYMGDMVGAGPSLPYPQRVQRLAEARIAVWDVIASCHRKGSLDSTIRDEAVNDFADFFAGHAELSTVLFNGAKAEASFVRWALPLLGTARLASAGLATAGLARTKRPPGRPAQSGLDNTPFLLDRGAPTGPLPVALRRLPSTSPANASQTEAVKQAAWRQALLDAGVRVITTSEHPGH